MTNGLRITRRFTQAGVDPFSLVEWDKRHSRITNPDGSVVFEMRGVEVPADWSQVATDIVVSRYFRKAGVPQLDEKGEPAVDESGAPVLGPEQSVKQTIRRLAGCWRDWGERYAYFASTEDAQAFEDELAYMLVRQMASPNSPQWFNTGLDWAYGIKGAPNGFWYVDPETRELVESMSSYERPAPHACFINPVRDDLVNPGGIMDLWVREARLFKFGSGTGTNFSALRAEGEKLSGGGSSSGLMSFLKVGDRAAGAIRSGGTTRRAAKMVILNLDHPDIERFIDWKVEEERKVAALVKAGYSADFNGEAYATVSGQNSNNSIRIPNEFMHTLAEGGSWELTSRTTGEVVRTVPARELWDKIASAAWHCADPGVQFDTIINDWHTCPADGRIEATNPCAEFVFLSSQACNLASINLLRFFDQGTRHFDIDAYLHAIRLWTIVLEISVLMAQFPSADIAMGSYTHRTLGLGYANLGSLLMQMGVPYDSDQGRAIMAAITAVLTGEAYATSAEMAAHLGPFEAFERNRESMLRVIRNHRRAAHGAVAVDYEALSIPPQVIDADACPDDLLAAARTSWDRALALGEQHGYRNAQTTVIAPTGCLVGGTLVPTSRGVVRLRSLGDPNGAQWQDLNVEVQTDEGTRNATQFYVNGAEPVVDVRTTRGYRLRGTPTHRVKVVDAAGDWVWKHLADVGPGDAVPLAMRQLVGEPQAVPLPPLADAYWTSDHTTIVPRAMTPELAEFVGYFMGDGSLHSRSIRLCVAAEDFDVVDHLVLAGKKLFGLEAAVTAKTGYTEVAFQSVRLVMWWEACGFAKWAPSEHRGKGYRPHIPDAVLHSNDPAVYGAFLRGLFEADGTVTVGHPTWTTATLEFADEVQALLLALGYPASRRSDISGSGASELAVVRLINGTYSARWLEDVGFMSARKHARVQGGNHPQSGRVDRVPLSRAMLDRLLPQNVALRRTILMALARHGAVARRSAEALLEQSNDAELRHLLGFYYDTVASAELGEAELTYDLSVPDNVTYVANGFVSHNTIGLQMDCDTTGVEPDFALVKFKKLAGGGYFKIVNQSVAPALRTLGYSPEQVEDIVRYVVGTNCLEGALHINRATLRAQGLSDTDLDKVDAVLPGVFELRHAMNVFTLGEEALARLGLSVEEYTSFDFNMLRSLGFTPKEIDEATDHICGHQTVEGAPHLRAEHLAVFDTANRNGRHGKRFIQPQGHIRALGAVAPFLSGSASKTVNLPQEATVADIEDAYMLSYRLGIKCMSVYRDGSKLSQPLSSGGSDDGESDEEESEQAGEALAVEHAVLTGQFPPGTSPAQAYAHSPRPRFLLPARRRGFTQEARVGGHKVFLRTGEYDDGTLGEVFIDLAKEGATLKGILSCFAIAVSKGLQYGVPLDEFVETFTFQNFEPKGMVEGHPNIKMSNSLVDYVFRALGLEYLNRTDLVQVPPGQQPLPGVAEAVEARARPTPDYNPPAGGASAPREPAHVAPGPSTPATHGPAQQAGAVPMTLHSLQEQLGTMMGDAPLCDTCGHITVRSGSCYRCLNCGASMGCS